tara:strand:- start:1987 stop:2202 length:216 start_codon:yes stop_codon:yes gene_type:complete
MTLRIGQFKDEEFSKLSKRESSSRSKIQNGIPSAKKMKEGQVIFCKIKDDIYQVIKAKGELYRQKYEKVEF